MAAVELDLTPWAAARVTLSLAAVGRGLTGAWLVMLGAALLASCVPFLVRCAEHGKRLAPPELRGADALGAERIAVAPQKQSLELVPKSWFSVFYVVGALWNGGLLAFFCGLGGRRWRWHGDADPAAPAWPLADFLLLLLFQVHVCRRLGECLLVHRFGASRMHVLGFLVGVAHYLLAPVTMLLASLDGLAHSASASPSSDGVVKPWLVGPLLGAFVLANLGQSHCHWLLAAGSRGPGRDGPQGKRYIVPRGGLWDVWAVSCPHYTCEILLYVVLVLLPAGRFGLSLEHAARLGHGSALAMLAWVVGNLSVSARSVHAWYLQRFGDTYARLRRTRLLPGVF